MIKFINGQPVELTEQEQNELLAKQSSYDTTMNDVLTESARSKRNELLAETDWTVCRSYDTGIDREDIKTYRQALRDISLQTGFPMNVIWPETPII